VIDLSLLAIFAAILISIWHSYSLVTSRSAITIFY